MMQDLDAWLDRHHDELTAIRRDIHAHPELGMEERRTSALVAGKLRDWGIDFAEGIGGTGIVGAIRGSRPGQRSIGGRAAMEAPAIEEENGFFFSPPKSRGGDTRGPCRPTPQPP